MMPLRCMLVMRDGPSRRVNAAGLVVGRQEDCDIVVANPALSRRHALVRATAAGAEIVPLGRTPVDVNGKPQDKPCALAHGDELAFAELSLRVELTEDADAAPAGYLLVRERGGAFGLAKLPFRIGGAPSDDLVIPDWPAGMLTLAGDAGDLFVTLEAGEAAHEGVQLAIGVRTPIAVGERVTSGSETLVIQSARAFAAATDVVRSDTFPTKVRIEILPRGGLAVFTVPSGDHTVFLADRRFDLLVALVQPPGGYVHGDFVDDDTVRSIVWPRNPGVGRTEINVVISRCRRDLVEAGLDGARLIQRAPGGGGTRLVLARDAEIVVKR